VRLQRSVIAAFASLLLVATGAVGLAAPAAATQPVDRTQVCAELDSGKKDVSGSHKTLTLEAPAGKLISGYCVKAGSAKQGNGPVYFTVQPPKKSVTISHPSGKDISHWALSYVDETTDPDPEPDPDPVVQLQVSCTSVSADFGRALTVGDRIDLSFSPGDRTLNAVVATGVTGGWGGHGLVMSTGTERALTQAEVSSGVVSWGYPTDLGLSSYTVTFAQAGDTQSTPSMLCETPDVPEECPEGMVALEDGTCEEPVAETYVDLGIQKTHSELVAEGTVEYGDEFSYFLTVTNEGTAPVTAGVVTDAVPAGMTVRDVIVPGGWVDETTGSDVRVTGVALAPGVSGVIEVQVQVEPSPEYDTTLVSPGDADPAEVYDLGGAFVNTACVDAPFDVDDTNDCATATIERDELVANVLVRCINDAPYLYYSVETSESLAGEPITLTWTPDSGPAVPAQVQLELASGDSGRIGWPGAVFAPNGNSIQWPGYRPLTEADYNADGTLAVDPTLVYNGLVLDTTFESHPWRLGSTVTLSVNPEVTVNTSYPEATVNCAVPRSADMTIAKTASVETVEPGDAFEYDLVAANVSVDSVADPVVITDVIPAELRVDDIVTDEAAFPRWQDCEVTGADASGFGGTVSCTLFGPLSIGATAPTITLAVTSADDVATASIANTAEVCWGSADSQGELVGCAEDSVVVTIAHTDPAPPTEGALPATGGVLPVLPALGGAAALLAGLALVAAGVVRRRVHAEG
jgi:uncharacterized repeat protein (TIGR01451 family)